MTTTELVRTTARPTLPEKIAYANELAQAGLLPTSYRRQPANVLYAIEYGETLNISSMAAITGIHVIEGKPSASAALIGGLVRRAGHKLRVQGNALRATAMIIRSDDPDYTFQVTWELNRNADGNPNAQDAGLLNKDVWKKYAASMLKARAISQVARDACEEVLFGLHYTPEELGAEVDAEGEPIVQAAWDGPQAVRSRQADGDVWETPAPPSPAQVIADQASAMTDRAKVREIYDRAKAEGLLSERVSAADGTWGELGGCLYEVGQRLAKADEVSDKNPTPGGDDEVFESELVPEDADEFAVALGEVYDAAATVPVEQHIVDRDFEQSYGHLIIEATVSELREMRDLLLAAA
ncbi:hypothetical protein [Embleya sp. NPDC001921]